MTAEIATNLDFLASAYKKMAEIIAQLLKKVYLCIEIKTIHTT